VSGEKRKLPDMVVHGYFKKYQKVDAKEGFSRNDTWDFTPLHFATAEQRRLFYMYLV
jgi:hypothetical protein